MSEQMTEKEAGEAWLEYYTANPRKAIPDELKDFLVYAQNTYKEAGFGVVNHTHSEDEEDFECDIDDYISDCSELLLLYRAYLMQKGEPNK